MRTTLFVCLAAGCVAPVGSVEPAPDAGLDDGAVAVWMIALDEPSRALAVESSEEIDTPNAETFELEPTTDVAASGDEGRRCRCYRCWRPMQWGTRLGGHCKCPDNYGPRRGICCRLPLRREPMVSFGLD